jgi:hypothetical protein
VNSSVIGKNYVSGMINSRTIKLQGIPTLNAENFPDE